MKLLLAKSWLEKFLGGAYQNCRLSRFRSHRNYGCSTFCSSGFFSFDPFFIRFSSSLSSLLLYFGCSNFASLLLWLSVISVALKVSCG